MNDFDEICSVSATDTLSKSANFLQPQQIYVGQNPRFILSGCNNESDKRLRHTLSEQKRRDAIKNGYQQLQLIVMPQIDQDSNSISKVAILKNALSFIQSMEEKLFALNQRLSYLKIETGTIDIENNPAKNYNSQIHERDVFQRLHLIQLFCTFLEYLFVSFSDAVDLSNFESLSGSMVHWIEMLNAPDTLCNILARFYHFEIDCKHIII